DFSTCGGWTGFESLFWRLASGDCLDASGGTVRSSPGSISMSAGSRSPASDCQRRRRKEIPFSKNLANKNARNEETQERNVSLRQPSSGGNSLFFSASKKRDMSAL